MPSSRRTTVWTYFISMAFGLVAAVLCFAVEWQQSGHPKNYLNGHYYGENKYNIDIIARAIENWRNTHGSLPESLKVLRNSNEIKNESYVRFNDEGEMIDGWHTPFIYRIEDDNFELICYGEDGKPGGIWFASDISNRQPYPPKSFAPSLGVFWSSEIGSGATMLSLLTGFFCFICGFILLRKEVPKPDETDEQQAELNKYRSASMASRLLAFALLVLFAVIVAYGLGAFHLIHGEYH